MYITANSNRKKQYYKTNEVDEKKVEQKYLDKYKFSKEFINENNTRFYATHTERNIITIDKEGEEDFLLIFRRKFDDIFKRYLKSYTYEEVRTTNMGSLYRITLSVLLKDNVSTKDFIDDLRTGNGNLDISLGRMIDSMDSL